MPPAKGTTNAVRLFTELVALPEERLADFTFAHPVLLTPAYWPAFRRNARALGGAQNRALQILEVLTSIHQDLSEDPRGYPRLGPLEAILTRWKKGEITLEEACRQASMPATSRLLSLVYVRAACGRAQGMSINAWRDALAFQKIVLAAVDARGEMPDQGEIAYFAIVAWIEVVARAVTHIPDGSLLNTAVARGDELAKKLTGERLGDLLFVLGVLHLDPYFAENPITDYQTHYRRWRDRLNAYAPADRVEVPEVAEALSRSVKYLRRAADWLSGDRRARALKALAEALRWSQKIAGVAVSDAEIISAAQEAMRLFDPTNVRARVVLAALLAAMNEKPAIGDVPVELPVATPQKTGDRLTLDHYRHAIGLAVHSGYYDDALQLWTKAWPLAQGAESEGLRLAFVKLGLQVFTAQHSQKDASVDTLLAKANESLRLAKKESWPEIKTAGRLLALIHQCQEADAEDVALSILASMRTAVPQFAAEYAEIVDIVEATFLSNKAVNHVQRKEDAFAADAYAASLGLFTRRNCPDAALNVLARIRSLLDGEDHSAWGRVLVHMTTMAVPLEALIGDPVRGRLRNLWSRLMYLFSTGEHANADLIWLIEQHAKGLVFATLMDRHAPIRVTEEEQAILEEIEQLRTRVKRGPAEDDLDASLRLAAYAGASQQKAGATPEERLANLEHRFDETRIQSELRLAVPAKTLAFSRDHARARLGQRTVVADLFLGNDGQGMARVWMHLIRGGSTHVSMGGLGAPDSEALVTVGGVEVPTHILAPDVAAIRKSVLEDPGGPRAVKPEVEALLRRYGDELFGHTVRRFLDRARGDGCDHLCIVPHGPLFLLPFHLLGYGGQALSADWIVTYLPNLHLLNRIPRAQKGGLSPIVVAALGKEVAADHGLEPLAGVEDEAEAIAALYGAEPVVGARATKRTVLDALQTSIRVHIATHGEFRVHAPSFQCLYLAHSDVKERDGVLYAHELAGLDMAGLDVITLSACETGLGRFDRSDNLRGITASLLKAGARTIVSTLWPVHSEASALFFKTFYSELVASQSKLMAFARAQANTRKRFPAYRDWGSFLLQGDWA